MLPEKKTKKKTDLRDFTILVYGIPKIGKSTACSRIPGALFLPTEPGLNSLEVFAMPQITSWEQFISICKEIAKMKHKFRTVVIDIVDNLYQLCAHYVCEREGAAHESDIGYGKGYAMIRGEFMRVLTKLAGLPTGLVLVSHSIEKEVEDHKGKKITKTMPNLPNTIRANITGMVDSILFATVDHDKDGKLTRIVKTLPASEYEAGDRTGMFKDNMPLADLFKVEAK